MHTRLAERPIVRCKRSLEAKEPMTGTGRSQPVVSDINSNKFACSLTLESLDRIQAGWVASCRCWKWKASGPRDATASIVCWR
ncbi:hypothetical protein CBM2634_B170103 [Cupriavidus taiwanensis]|uniref:Uncharacterized protein n=1 Tax=Cupriavidus taiwanensis TaxID=164546 RepID=A0A375JB05_9BURK|nr:hypothetical protein CBM2634_B170103 [Cupriavidus taiwanensis]